MSPESDDQDGSTTLALALQLKRLPKQREVGDKTRDIRAELRAVQEAFDKASYNRDPERRLDGRKAAYAAAERAQMLCHELKDMFGLE